MSDELLIINKKNIAVHVAHISFNVILASQLVHCQYQKNAHCFVRSFWGGSIL